MTDHPVSEANDKQIACQELKFLPVRVSFFKISKLGKSIFEVVNKPSDTFGMIPMIFFVDDIFC